MSSTSPSHECASSPHGQPGAQSLDSDVSEPMPMDHSDPVSVHPRPQHDDFQTINNYILGGQGGQGGGGGVQGHGGGGGAGEGPTLHYNITANNFIMNTVYGAAAVQASPAVNRCPPPSRIFQGQQAFLDAMHRFFAEQAGKQRIYVLYGLGGAGKTQIALKFIEEYSQFTDRLLVDASMTQTIETGLKNIAITKKTGDSPQDALNWLATPNNDQWLLFLDNADDPKIDLNRFFPQCNHGNIIITSRNPNLRVYGAHSQVSNTEESDPVASLLKRADQETSPQNALLASEIVKVLCYLPLAIVQAGAFISESGALDTYLGLYTKSQAQLLREKPAQSHDAYAWTVFTTWQMSFDKLSPPAATLLQLCSFLHQDGISEDLFSRAATHLMKNKSEQPSKLAKLKLKFLRVWSRSGPSRNSAIDRMEDPQGFLSHFLGTTGEWDSRCFLEFTNEIKAYSLINFDAEQKLFSIYPLVQSWCRTTLADPDRYHSCMGNILARFILEIFQEDITLASPRIVSHVDSLMQIMPEKVNDFGLQYAIIYQHAGQYADAAKLGAIGLEGRRKLLGDGHLETLTAMENLANTYNELGRHEEAESLQSLVIEKRRKLLGDNHSDTLAAINNLARTYRSLGRFQEANKLMILVVEKQKQHHGDDSGGTLAAMSDLAINYSKHGLLEAARELELVVLEKRRKLLGDDHLHTLCAMNNLANTSARLCRWQETERLQLVVLEKWRRLLGDNHPNTLIAMNNLARTYYHQGHLVKAEELQTVVLERRRELLGHNHPHTQLAVQTLAQTYRKLDKQIEAEELEKSIDRGLWWTVE
ncbi:P-loop containing nucleoside triphosphate hydrolase protein [Mycena galopus ATCC 62051]|nr:P-loop containing nucleoside triphosphate hydrolase protein [Mycena galopus ATCC 62051]